MSFVLELLLEFVLQLVFEILAEVASHAFKRERPRVNPAVAVCAYALIGAALGWVSCVVFPHALVSFSYAAVINLAVTPVAVGLVLAAIGAWRSRRGTELVRLDRFAYGYTFALAFALARFALVTAG